MKKVIFAMGLFLLAATSCTNKVKTVVLTTTPQMHCEKCENRVKDNLSKVEGVEGITTDLVSQTVTVKYDASKLSEEELINSFKDFEYEARKLNPGEKIEREKHECQEEKQEEVETE